MEALFNKQNVHDYKSGVVHLCAQMVNAWPEHVFSDGSLDTRIAEIESKARVAVPDLDLASRRGKRRQQSREDRFGRQVQYDVIDISVPFDGDAICFDLSPSSYTLGTRGRIQGNTLILTFPDNDRLESEVDEAVKTIANNLANLGKDLESLRTQVREAVSSSIGRRNDELERRKKLDASRSFPID